MGKISNDIFTQSILYDSGSEWTKTMCTGANKSWKQFLTKKAKLHDPSVLCKLYQSLNTEAAFSRLKLYHNDTFRGMVTSWC